MRVKRKTGSKMSPKDIRAVETENGVYLVEPVKKLRTNNQQFGVYDENEVYVGDIVAAGIFFGEVELRVEIRKLFNS